MAAPSSHRVNPTRRQEERVTPLELFFDLVFVLAITQCTSLMVDEPTWAGLGKGLVVLGVLWWAWVGYAWLTSVVDPEEGAVRLVIIAAMAGLVVVALCVPEAFGDLGLLFAIAYGVVRYSQIVLFVLASREDGALRHSVLGLAVSTAIGVALLVVASMLDGAPQGALWAVALLLDMGGPLLIDASGWRLEPGHFAERHGLIIIIALGESIVALGAAAHDIDGGIVIAAVLGLVLSAALWWLYFDVISYVATRNLAQAPAGVQRNTLARDAYSYMHLVMVSGIVVVAFGLHETLEHVGEPLHTVPAAALFGGTAVYLLGHVAFTWRNMGRVKPHRLIAAALIAALLPLGTEVDAVVALAVVTAVLCALIVYETLQFAEPRRQVRAELAHPHAAATQTSDTT
jgi:low temperature requirement protein LtrA